MQTSTPFARELALYDQYCEPHRQRRLDAVAAKTSGFVPLDGPWFVAVTNTNCERRATQGLEDVGFEVWWPTRVVEVKTRYMKQAEPREYPAFPGYLFVRPRTAPTWHAMIGVDGIRAIIKRDIGGELRPAPISNEEIKRLKVSLAPDAIPVVREAFRSGEHVWIEDGPFMSLPAVIERLCGKGYLEVAVDVFGRSTPVHIEQGSVQRIS